MGQFGSKRLRIFSKKVVPSVVHVLLSPATSCLDRPKERSRRTLDDASKSSELPVLVLVVGHDIAGSYELGRVELKYKEIGSRRFAPRVDKPFQLGTVSKNRRTKARVS